MIYWCSFSIGHEERGGSAWQCEVAESLEQPSLIILCIAIDLLVKYRNFQETRLMNLHCGTVGRIPSG
jgi:hypothetical protein